MIILVIMAGVTLMAIIGNEFRQHHEERGYRRQMLYGLLCSARFIVDMNEIERACQVEIELQELKAEMGLEQEDEGKAS